MRTHIIFHFIKPLRVRITVEMNNWNPVFNELRGIKGARESLSQYYVSVKRRSYVSSFQASLENMSSPSHSYGDEVERWMNAANHWSASAIDDAIQRAYDADSQIKSTTIKESREILYTMLLYFAAKEAP